MSKPTQTGNPSAPGMMMETLMVVSVRTAIIGDRSYPWSYLWGELHELLIELVRFNRSGIREEFQDCAYAAQMLFSQSTGADFRLRGCREAVQKFLDRIEKWQEIFERRGVPFSVDYLSGGSNYQKPAKVQAAFAKAGLELGLPEAQYVAVTAMEPPPTPTVWSTVPRAADQAWARDAMERPFNSHDRLYDEMPGSSDFEQLQELFEGSVTILTDEFGMYCNDAARDTANTATARQMATMKWTFDVAPGVHCLTVGEQGSVMWNSRSGEWE